MKKAAALFLALLLTGTMCLYTVAFSYDMPVLCSDKTTGINDGDSGTDRLNDPTADTGFDGAVGVFEQLPDSSGAVPNYNSYNYKTVAARLSLVPAILGGAALAGAVVLFILFFVMRKRIFIILAPILLAAGLGLFAVSYLTAPSRIAFAQDEGINASLETTEQQPEYQKAQTFRAAENAYPEDRSPKLVKTEYETQSTIVADMNVADFGAVGDGMTDCTVAFAGAIDQLSRRGGTVFVPKGRYVLSEGLDLPTGVSLTGETDKDGAPASVLLIYSGKGDEGAKSAVVMGFQSALKNIAFYYPEQEFSGGAPIPYPYTVTQNGSEGILLENVHFINSYRAVNLAFGENNSLQTLRKVCGTPLMTGISLDGSLDIGRFEGIDFSYKYWEEFDGDKKPDQKLLRTWLLRNAVGFEVGMVDWTYFSGFNIEGYNIGLKFCSSSKGTANGHLYGSSITDCYYAVYINNSKWLNFTDCTLTAYGNQGAAAVYLEKGGSTTLSLVNCSVESCGKNAVYDAGFNALTTQGGRICSNGGSPYVTKSEMHTFVDTEFFGDQTQYKVTENTLQLCETSVDLDRKMNQKPAGEGFVNLNDSVSQRKDISTALQEAIDSLKDTGGTVYIPGGYYFMSSPVTVYEGVEIRGCEDIPNYFPKTVIYTDFGRDDGEGQALFTLKSRSGMRGIGVHYYKQSTDDIRPYSFTVRGEGSDIYVINTALINSYNGIDFAANRCDRHYIEYVWGTPLYRGITVGAGSTDGVIRDVHYTPNAWYAARDSLEGKGHSDFNTRLEYIKANSQPFVIGESVNEILFHNFVYGAYRGLTLLDGAKNAVALGHGVDCGNIAIYAEGDGEIALIDPQLVNLPGVDRNYIFTSESFSGSVTAVNAACWGDPLVSFRKTGVGSLKIFGASIDAAGTALFECNGGEVYASGLFNRSESTPYDFILGKNSGQVTSVGNMFVSGLKYRLEAPEGLFKIIK